ncbi:MAG: hypothetical protein HZC37_17020 [Burkholderiales bacterium]|nr:hypothetical protein [Burkholderiales bacterium]
MKSALLIVVAAALLGCTMPTDAQIVPAARAKPAVIADAAMVIQDRGQALEIYPTLRATPSVKPGTPGVQHRLSSAGESAPIGPRNLGVIFNHALQVRGYLTGEITFQPKGEGLPAGIDAAGYPGLAKITNPNTYVVLASSPKEFIALFNRLKERTDLEWVQAVVIYGGDAGGASGR